MLKVTTTHGTYYLIDLVKDRALRIKGEDRREFIADNIWFSFSKIRAYDHTAKEEDRFKEGIHEGYPMFFNLVGHIDYDWIISSPVTQVEEVEDEEIYAVPF